MAPLSLVPKILKTFFSSMAGPLLKGGFNRGNYMVVSIKKWSIIFYPPFFHSSGSSSSNKVPTLRCKRMVACRRLLLDMTKSTKGWVGRSFFFLKNETLEERNWFQKWKSTQNFSEHRENFSKIVQVSYENWIFKKISTI